MRKVLLAVAVAALAIAAGPPALAEGVHEQKAYQVDKLEKVTFQDLGFTARAVYHPADEDKVGILVSERSAGKKTGDVKKGEKERRSDRAAAPPYHLRL